MQNFSVVSLKLCLQGQKNASTWGGVNTLSVFVCIYSNFSSGEDKDEENEETEESTEDEDGKWMELAQQLLESLK